ncbi:MAG: hypothetical protein F6K19_25305 [Cyanothece sp. SIO1E1]|nr:hypothetical protein [Cyanothece sp. SIO1E1]
MPKFHLKTAQELQGKFVVRDLNLLLVFQVNCPGCFVYALPLAARLHQQYGTRLNMLGLSTAFEDFELNTAKNTQRLLEKSELVGVTRQYFLHHGKLSYPIAIQFPVAFDQLGQSHELFNDADVEHMCHLNPAFIYWDAASQAQARSQVKQFLKRRSPTAYTFTINQLQGTPSWILFDAGSTSLAQWFGHKSEGEVESIIAQALEQTVTVTVG